MLAPEQLRRIFGAEPRLFITPMRDLIVGMPTTVEPGFALWLHTEFAALDPNCLGPTGYHFDGERVRPFALDTVARTLDSFRAPLHLA